MLTILLDEIDSTVLPRRCGETPLNLHSKPNPFVFIVFVQLGLNTQQQKKQ